MANDFSKELPTHRQVKSAIEQILLPNSEFLTKHLDPFDYDDLEITSTKQYLIVKAYAQGTLAAELVLTRKKREGFTLTVKAYQKVRVTKTPMKTGAAK
jgi:hypothetical protein